MPDSVVGGDNMQVHVASSISAAEVSHELIKSGKACKAFEPKYLKPWPVYLYTALLRIRTSAYINLGICEPVFPVKNAN